ncbi:MAG TPA: chemotaxis protein CheW [Nitrospirae bacterium]|nr:chemotaxis protein CheW [Nitrospirota bacterium]
MDALILSNNLDKKENVSEELLQLVTLTLGTEEYAVDILKVQEINRMKEITRVPNSPSYVEGVINLRGKVIPVVNLRSKFGLQEKENDERTRIIIMDIQGIIMGLIVDSVSEVLRIPSNIVEPTPPMASNISSEFIKGIAKLEDRLIILLDMDKLLGKTDETALIEMN